MASCNAFFVESLICGVAGATNVHPLVIAQPEPEMLPIRAWEIATNTRRGAWLG